MKIVQAITYISALIISALFFIFTLSFSSGWALGEPLGDFFVNAQAANKDMFNWALRTVIAAAFILIFNTHKNKQLFIFNYLAIIASAGLMIYSGIVVMDYMPGLEAQYLELNELFLQIITAVNYSEISTSIFQLGMVVSYALIIDACLLMLLTGYKIYEQIKRAKTKKQLRMGASE